MRTRSTFTKGASRVRYLVCPSCGATGKEILQIDDLGRTIILPVVATRSKQGDAPLPFIDLSFMQGGQDP
ncbi:MAG: hypothetical protein MUC43_00120 [Pirellula sp.]|nr:hypothetical protein [Pirellula sp.]